MSIASRPIALGVIAFTVTLGIVMWWQHQSDPEEAPAVGASTGHPISMPVIPPPVGGSRPAPAIAETKLPFASAPITVADDPPPEAVLAQVPVPASIVLGAMVDATSRAVTLRNQSGATLDVTVTASNPETGHQASIQVTVPPFRFVKLYDAGLSVEVGDQLILHSPPFADRELKTELN